MVASRAAVPGLPWGTLAPYNHPTSAGPRSHHAIGMKSSVCPAPMAARGQKYPWLIGTQVAHNTVTGCGFNRHFRRVHRNATDGMKPAISYREGRYHARG